MKIPRVLLVPPLAGASSDGNASQTAKDANNE